MQKSIVHLPDVFEGRKLVHRREKELLKTKETLKMNIKKYT